MLTIKYIIWYLILEPAVSSCTGGCHTAPMAGLHSLHCANWHWLEAVPFNVWWPLCIISCSVAGIAVTGFLATTILNKTWITSYLFVQTPYFSFIHNWPYWVHDIFIHNWPYWVHDIFMSMVCVQGVTATYDALCLHTWCKSESVKKVAKGCLIWWLLHNSFTFPFITCRSIVLLILPPLYCILHPSPKPKSSVKLYNLSISHLSLHADCLFRCVSISISGCVQGVTVICQCKVCHSWDDKVKNV